MGKGPSRLKKSEFSCLLGKVWKEIPSKNIQSGFRATGLYPLNKNVIKEDRFAKGDSERFRLSLKKGDQLAPATLMDPLLERRSLMNLQPDGNMDNQPLEHIIKIFSSNISNSTATAGPSSAPAPVRRLKHHTKGEVLTNADVVARLEEAESKRGNKRSDNGKPGRPKKQQT